MDRVTLFVIELLSLLVVASAGNGNFSTQNGSSNAIAEATGQNQDKQSSVACQHTALCCRLGRKAVRLSYTASVYTCKIEALSQGLKYHTSASHRLSIKSSDGQTDRMDAANSLRMSYGFRWRLKLCESQGTEQKRCFQDCCERKQREEQARAKTTAQRRKQTP
ncbi:uncharacterized protein LOC110046586 [Orbicella faveolata]|uniref:uncharacterized protein LOC110046586 n=1 Tax=Orbicella faveolata TaxID=48498 RepID=UPI0009E5141C|nr:uncharacterized protein LOC110046586 [Orbicella faveolata]